MPDKIIGFSKLSRDEKISWVSKNFLDNSDEFESILAIFYVVVRSVMLKNSSILVSPDSI